MRQVESPKAPSDGSTLVHTVAETQLEGNSSTVNTATNLLGFARSQFNLTAAIHRLTVFACGKMGRIRSITLQQHDCIDVIASDQLAKSIELSSTEFSGDVVYIMYFFRALFRA